MDSLSPNTEVRQIVAQCFRTVSSSPDDKDIIGALQTLHSFLDERPESATTSVQRAEFRRAHYTRTLQFLVSNIQADWLHKLTAAQRAESWDVLFLHGPPEQALLVLMEGIGALRPGTNLDFLVSITQKFLQTGRLADLLWSYCLETAPSDSPQLRETLLGRIVAFPDLTANRLHPNNKPLFLPQQYYPLLTTGMLTVLERTCKALKDGTDCSLTFVAQTLGKVCIQGHSAVCPEALGRIIGNLVLTNKKAQFVITHKLLLLQYKYETQVLRIVLGYLAADRDRRPLLIQVLRSVSQAWANPSAVKHTPLEQQVYVSKALLLSVSLLKDSELQELRSDLLQCMLGGMQSHLDSSVVHIRRLGMVVGECLSSRMDINGAKLKFEYDQDAETRELLSLMTPVTSDEPEPVNSVEEASEVTPSTQSASPQNKSGPQPSNTDPDSDLDSDDELTPYDMSGDQEMSQASPPRYLRDCLENLISSEDPARVELSLRVAESLVRKNIFATREISVQMTKVLLHMEDKYSITSFLSLRQATMVALTVTDCVPVTQYLTKEFYSLNYSLRQRLDILEVLALAAQELSKPITEKRDPSINTAASTDLSPYPGDNPVHWRQVVEKRIQSKTKRLMKGTTQPPPKATPNRYAPVAGHFFFPLLRNYDKPQVTFDLMGSDHLVLGRLIHTLGLFMHLAVNAPIAAQMGRALLDFVWAVRYHVDQMVRRGVLFAVCSVFLSMPSQNLLLDLSDQLFETRTWLADVAEGDPDADCRSLAVQSLVLLDKSLKKQLQDPQALKRCTGDMAVYFDHRIEALDSSAVPSQSTWHSALPVLAVASSTPATGGNVDLYLQQGEHVETCHVERPQQPTVLRWHPTKPVLALGWENGEVVLLTHPSGDQTVLPNTHTACITLLEWSSSGSRLVSGDQNGALAVWKVDARGRLTGNYLVKHEYNKPLTCCIFRPASPGETCVSCKIGQVHIMDERCKTSTLLSVEGSIKKMFYLEKREALVVITEAMMLSQYTLGSEGGAQEFMKVKLSSKSGQNVDIVWTDNNLLITATGEQTIRLWDLEQDDNYILSLDETLGFERGEMINCVSYCAGKEILAAGTSHGRIAFWKMAVQPGGSKGDTKAQWKLQTPTEIQGNVTQLQWGSSLNLLAANNSNTVLILCEHVMSAHFSQQVAAVQLTPTQLSITQFTTGVNLALQSEIHIKGVCVTKDSVTIWSGKQVTVYELSGTVLRNTGSFPCDSHIVAVHGENLYTVEPNRVQIRTPQGTVKQLLTFSKAEGNPVLLSVCQSYLVVGTDTAHIRVFDLSRRDAKAHCSAKNLADQISNLGALRAVKCNANGSQVSILISQVNGRPDHKVYFYDVEMDTVTHFDFFIGRPSSGISHSEDSESSYLYFRQQFQGTELSGRCPVSIFWDESEPRLFVCETVPISSESSSTTYSDVVDVSVVTLFCTQEHGLLLQDCYPKPTGLQALLALDVPYYYFSCKPGEGDPEVSATTSAPPHQTQSSKGTPTQFPPMVSRRALRDFVGLEKCEKATRDAMLNFSFYLTIGDMDEAFKSIKLIKR
ncbi:hypothetical protein INR49_013556 [Caranx melampygus]|nr:hypothetical protein INR49_013556 [Caranx melampygus]